MCWASAMHMPCLCETGLVLLFEGSNWELLGSLFTHSDYFSASAFADTFMGYFLGCCSVKTNFIASPNIPPTVFSSSFLKLLGGIGKFGIF